MSEKASFEVAKQLFESGRSHALASDFLYRSAIEDGERREVDDPELFAFNGTYSLSTHYLLGLGLELMLKSAVVAWSGVFDEKALRDIGHDLPKALDAAKAAGFSSNAPHLNEIIDVMQKPYKEHWLRYQRPTQFALPGDFTQVVATLEVLDGELSAKLWATG